jgi:hypothetical protein
MSLIEIGFKKVGAHHSEWELEKHEQRDRWEDDIRGQGVGET